MQGTFAVYVKPGIILTPEVIRRRRKELKLTQAKFSKRVGVATETDSRWERGRLIPTKKNRLKIVEVLKLEKEADSVFQTGEAQKVRQLTAQETGPAGIPGPDNAGKTGAAQSVKSRAADSTPFSEALNQVIEAFIGDKVENYLAARVKDNK